MRAFLCKLFLTLVLSHRTLFCS